jgi:hypothetical protein
MIELSDEYILQHIVTGARFFGRWCYERTLTEASSWSAGDTFLSAPDVSMTASTGSTLSPEVSRRTL